jgi:hypothetical protein
MKNLFMAMRPIRFLIALIITGIVLYIFHPLFSGSVNLILAIVLFLGIGYGISFLAIVLK